MNLSEAAKVVGVAQPVLTRWIQNGVIRPPGWQNRRGVSVPIGPKELRELAIIRQLRQAGLSFQAIRRAAKFLKELGENPFSNGKFAVIAGGELVRVVDSHEAMALLHQPGQLLLLKLEDCLPSEEQHES